MILYFCATGIKIGYAIMEMNISFHQTIKLNEPEKVIKQKTK